MKSLISTAASALLLAHSFAEPVLSLPSTMIATQRSDQAFQGQILPSQTLAGATASTIPNTQATHSLTPISDLMDYASEAHSNSYSFTPSSIISASDATSTQRVRDISVVSNVISPEETTRSDAVITSPSIPTPDSSTSADINTLHTRRLPFIISSATKATSISAW